jgi:predicted RNase H-like HicB family nuclease
MADGKSYAEALENVQVVINDWIETAQSLGRPIPEPKGKLMYA